MECLIAPGRKAAPTLSFLSHFSHHPPTHQQSPSLLLLLAILRLLLALKAVDCSTNARARAHPPDEGRKRIRERYHGERYSMNLTR